MTANPPSKICPGEHRSCIFLILQKARDGAASFCPMMFPADCWFPGLQLYTVAAQDLHLSIQYFVMLWQKHKMAYRNRAATAKPIIALLLKAPAALL